MFKTKSKKEVMTFNSVFPESPLKTTQEICDFMDEAGESKDEDKIRRIITFLEEAIAKKELESDEQESPKEIINLGKILYVDRLDEDFLKELTSSFSISLNSLLNENKKNGGLYQLFDCSWDNNEYRYNQSPDIYTEHLFMTPSSDTNYALIDLPYESYGPDSNDMPNDVYLQKLGSIFSFDVKLKESKEMLGKILLMFSGPILGKQTNFDSFSLSFDEGFSEQQSSYLLEASKALIEAAFSNRLRSHHSEEEDEDLKEFKQRSFVLDSRKVNIINFVFNSNDEKMKKLSTDLGLTHNGEITIINEDNKKETISIYSILNPRIKEEK